MWIPQRGERMENGDDLISRQAAIETLHMHLMYRMGTDSNKKRLDDWINSLPSAQPKIVRCKDCKWKQGSECVRFAEVRPFPDDFCSRAERRKQ